MKAKNVEKIEWYSGTDIDTVERDKILMMYSEATKSMRLYKKITMFTSVILLILAMFIGVVWYSGALIKLLITFALLWLVFVLNWMLSYVFYRYPIQLNSGNFEYAFGTVTKLHKNRVGIGRLKAERLNKNDKLHLGAQVIVIRLSDAVLYAIDIDSININKNEDISV